MLAAAPARTFGKWGRGAKGAKGTPKGLAAPKKQAAKGHAAAPVRLAAKEVKSSADKKAPAHTAPPKAKHRAAPKAKKSPAKKKP